MKKKRIILIIIMIILITCGICKPAFGESSLYVDEYSSFSMNVNSLCDTYDNVYCIDNTHDCSSQGGYKAVTHIEIDGNYVTITRLKDGATTGKKLTTTSNTLGAILCPNGWLSMGYSHLSRTEFGQNHGASCNKYSDAQMALWYYWPSFAAETGVGSYTNGATISMRSCTGGNQCYGDPYGYGVTCAKGIVAAENGMIRGESYTYYGDLWICTASSSQTLLVADIDYSEGPPTDDPPTTSVTVTKEFKKSDDKNYGNIPTDGISVTLMVGNSKVKKDSDGDSITNPVQLKSGRWSYEWENLPAEDDNGNTINYYVTESVPAGYKSSPDIEETSTNDFTIINTLRRTSVTVNKVWNDENNRDGKRANATVTLYETINGTKSKSKDASGKTRTATLGTSDDATATFSNLPTHRNGSEITYSVDETTVPTGYTKNVTQNSTNNFTITNTHNPEKIEVTVKKDWDDTYNEMEDFDELRPEEVEITLYDGNGNKVTKDANGKAITSIKLNKQNNWSYTFKDLYKYEPEGKIIEYKVVETPIKVELNGQTVSAYGDKPAEEDYDIKILTDDPSTSDVNEDGYRIITVTNKHEPNYDYGYTEIRGTVWSEGPSGKANDTSINATLDGGENEKGLQGINVILKKADGSQFDDTSTAVTDTNGNYVIKVNYDNTKDVYKLHEKIDQVEEDLKTAYIEFQYDGLLYTTLAPNATETNTSKAKEIYSKREEIDNRYYAVDANTPIYNPNNDHWSEQNRKVTASTKDVITSFEEYEKANSRETTSQEILKYCNGNGTYIRTNPEKPWMDILPGTNDLACNSGTGHEIEGANVNVKVKVIDNVNLGLFDREQPNVAIFSDLTKVEVTMNKQQYTYLYGVRSTKYENSPLQTKFQNKGVYTYKRPVNPADIAYIQDLTDTEYSQKGMKVLVTYEVKVANLSATLQTTVDSIMNSFDIQYKNPVVIIGDTSRTMDVKKGEFNEGLLSGLNIALQAGKEEKITITYEVSSDAIKGLLNNQPTLNNAVEIYSYSTKYGEETLYAEQGFGGRTNNKYAGYDFNSHPGNANIQLKEDPNDSSVKRLYSTDANGKIILPDEMEDDTDIAPSFELCLNTATTLQGTVWEDTDVTANEERKGNGYIDSSEKYVTNVKVELYERNDNGTVQLAQLYNNDGSMKNWSESVVSTNENGIYELSGVVTGKEYFVVYTYGNNTDDPNAVTPTDTNGTTIDGKKVNARNYKSTIITDTKIQEILGLDYTDPKFDKKWPINHEDNYSVAVDNMKQRLNIESLKNDNFEDEVYISAYTKPFITPLEFDYTGELEGNSADDGKLQDKEGTEITNVLNRLDFGIIERPHEDLVIQKTITNFKITLSNGQVLTEGNPSDSTADIPYTKTMGFVDVKSIQDARNQLEKQLLVEMDTELIQGAQLDVKYSINVFNNNEIDYDYQDYDSGEDNPYPEIKSIVEEGTTVIDGYIANSSTQKEVSYYYFGDAGVLPELKAEIQIVDYLSRDMSFSKDENTNWDNDIDLKAYLKDRGFISQEALDAINKYGYKVLQNSEDDDGDRKIIIERGGHTSTEMTAYKILANKDENVYDNNAEIIEIDGKTARTVKAKIKVYDEDGNQKEEPLIYVPGNYEPGKEPEHEEPDDDRVKIIISPPTGITNNIITYVITILTGLIVVLIGVIFIKKKVLIK